MKPRYSTKAILNWLNKKANLSDYKESKNEAKLPCPKCGHSNFYFNLNKLIGYCHRASCHWAPNLNDLIGHLGSKPSDYFDTSLDLSVKHTKTAENGRRVTFSPNMVPLIEVGEKGLETRFYEAVTAVAERGVTAEQMHKYDFRIDAHRIYIPVYEKGELVQWVGRLHWWHEPIGFIDRPKYLYAKGLPISYYFFGWDEAKHWEWLTLVENTFVSLWLRDKFNCVSTFGSHLSATAIGKLIQSSVKHLIFLWDEETETATEKLAKRIRGHGINVTRIKILGQPDDYPYDFVANLVAMARITQDPVMDAKEACRAWKNDLKF